MTTKMTTPLLEEMKKKAKETLRLNIEMIPSDFAIKEIYRDLDHLIEETHSTAKREALREVREYSQKQVNIHEHFLTEYEYAPFEWHKGRKIEAEETVDFITHLESELSV